jgi:hypothetical protein
MASMWLMIADAASSRPSGVVRQARSALVMDEARPEVSLCRVSFVACPFRRAIWRGVYLSPILEGTSAPNRAWGKAGISA